MIKKTPQILEIEMAVTIKRREAQANSKQGGQGGKRAEITFDEECIKRGYHSFEATNDKGIDRIVMFNGESGERIYKTVQITVASPQIKDGRKPTNSTVAKPATNIRKDVDLVAVGVPWNSEERSINSGKMGNHVMWLLIPADVYCDDRMFKYYNTIGSCWSLPFVAKFKPPLDKAFDAWYLFTRATFSKQLVDSFF